MVKLRLALRRLLPACLIAMALSCSFEGPLLAEDKAPAGSLEAPANDFWQWRARYQLFSTDAEGTFLTAFYAPCTTRMRSRLVGCGKRSPVPAVSLHG